MIFESFELVAGLLHEFKEHPFVTRFYAWDNKEGFASKNVGKEVSFIGYVHEGEALLQSESNQYELKTGQYFCINENIKVSGGKGILIESLSYKGMNCVGGPIESWGRLKYIDGCTDTLLIPPVKLGDPCLNALYFPPLINQTQHTHPSFRLGIVARGKGECIIPGQTIPLYPGKIFIIHQDGLHSFRTFSEDSMTIIAYHPDSDFGPKDEDHPMINRTYVEGISASQINGIRTE